MQQVQSDTSQILVDPVIGALRIAKLAGVEAPLGVRMRVKSCEIKTAFLQLTGYEISDPAKQQVGEELEMTDMLRIFTSCIRQPVFEKLAGKPASVRITAVHPHFLGLEHLMDRAMLDKTGEVIHQVFFDRELIAAKIAASDHEKSVHCLAIVSAANRISSLREKQFFESRDRQRPNRNGARS